MTERHVTERRLTGLQRLSALVLAPLVVAHLVLILIAVRDGLTAGEILGRTQGSVGWAMFYGVFVLAAAVHAPIGIRNILREWAGLPESLVNWVAVLFGLMLLGFGSRAVVAVVA